MQSTTVNGHETLVSLFPAPPTPRALVVSTSGSPKPTARKEYEPTLAVEASSSCGVAPQTLPGCWDGLTSTKLRLLDGLWRLKIAGKWDPLLPACFSLVDATSTRAQKSLQGRAEPQPRPTPAALKEGPSLGSEKRPPTDLLGGPSIPRLLTLLDLVSDLRRGIFDGIFQGQRPVFP